MGGVGPRVKPPWVGEDCWCVWLDLQKGLNMVSCLSRLMVRIQAKKNE